MSKNTGDEDVVVLTSRDVVLGEGSERHKANFFLQDVFLLNRILWKLQGKRVPDKEEQISALTDHIIGLIKRGKSVELAGLKDVPHPFLKSSGRFLAKEGEGWKELSDAEAKDILTKALLEEFQLEDLGNINESPLKDVKDMMSRKTTGEQDDLSPSSKDVIVLPLPDSEGSTDKMYEHHGGNKTMFNLASSLVTAFSTTPKKRVDAALLIMRELDVTEPEPEDGEAPGPSAKYARFLIRTTPEDETITWDILDIPAAAEFCLSFVFEVFLEKEVHPDDGAASADDKETATSQPSFVPIDQPSEHDVLFGRGGMTNSHPGNRRFRDIISLHRPDYIRAIKMDKPGVARKIVRAIRTGAPIGKFLKKGEDGKWYDVGDRTAAEKTSQALRERSNAEKRQRSALREALRIRKQDMKELGSPSKAVKTNDPSGMPDLGPSVLTQTLNYVGTNLPVPLSLSMKDQTKVNGKKKGDDKDGLGELNTAGLPPNAVDEEGNILVTDYDILCGRGGLTNHHKGNKRFRDIVALHRPDYVRAPKIQKPSVARVIVRAIRNGDPPGRFLRKDEKAGKWFDIGDKKAAEKTSQALREKTNEERDNLKRDPNALGAGMGVLLPSPSSYLAAVAQGTMFTSIPPTVVPMKTEPEEKAEEKNGSEEEGDEKEEKKGVKDEAKAADDSIMTESV